MRRYMGTGSLSNNTFWSHKLVPHYFLVYQSMSYVTPYYHHHPETFIFQAAETSLLRISQIPFSETLPMLSKATLMAGQFCKHKRFSTSFQTDKCGQMTNLNKPISATHREQITQQYHWLRRTSITMGLSGDVAGTWLSFPSLTLFVKGVWHQQFHLGFLCL